MARRGVWQEGEIRAIGPFHMQDDGEVVGSVDAGNLIVATDIESASIGILIELPPVLKVAREDGLSIRPAQIMAQMHDNDSTVSAHVAIFGQRHFSELIGLRVKMVVED